MSGSVIDKAKGAMGDGVMWVLGLADRPENALARKVARIAMSVALISIALLAFYATLQGGNFFHPTLSAFLNPSLMTMMGMPMMLGAAGIGLSWVIQDLVGENNRTAAKVCALIMPFGLVAAAGCLIAAGCHLYFTGHSITNALIAGALFIPGVFLTVQHARNVFKEKDYECVNDTFDSVVRKENRPKQLTFERRGSRPRRRRKAKL